MRRLFRIVLPCVWSLAICVPAALAEDAKTPAAAPRQPVKKEAPVKPATPAKKEAPAKMDLPGMKDVPGKKDGPVKKDGAGKKDVPAGKTPVVPPHGPIHPHKPAAPQPTALPAPAVPQPAAPVVMPVPVPAETKPAPVSDKRPAAEKPADPDAPEVVKLPLPRFASLRSDEVNMRVGPGSRYRIEWVYKRRDLPVEIEKENEAWRYVRDAEGIKGWVNAATLIGRRTFIVQQSDATLHADPKDSATAVAILKPGVIGRIRSCEPASAWCAVQTGSYHGYLRRDAFWGTMPGEQIKP